MPFLTHDDAQSTELNTTTWYRLTNSPHLGLDVVNTSDNPHGKIELRNTGDYSGQYWRLRRLHAPLPDGPENEYDDDLWSLETMYLGPNKRLDVWGDRPKEPHLADRGAFTGQRWWIVPCPDARGEYRLSNTYSGLYYALDSKHGKEVVLKRADQGSATQRWRFVPAMPIEER